MSFLFLWVPKEVLETIYTKELSVTKTQHQNPEFAHTQGEILKRTCKKERIFFGFGLNSGY
jgi:hypothetical protein